MGRLQRVKTLAVWRPGQIRARPSAPLSGRPKVPAADRVRCPQSGRAIPLTNSAGGALGCAAALGDELVLASELEGSGHATFPWVVEGSPGIRTSAESTLPPPAFASATFSEAKDAWAGPNSEEGLGWEFQGGSQRTFGGRSGSSAERRFCRS